MSIQVLQGSALSEGCTIASIVAFTTDSLKQALNRVPALPLPEAVEHCLSSHLPVTEVMQPCAWKVSMRPLIWPKNNEEFGLIKQRPNQGDRLGPIKWDAKLSSGRIKRGPLYLDC